MKKTLVVQVMHHVIVFKFVCDVRFGTLARFLPTRSSRATCCRMFTRWVPAAQRSHLWMSTVSEALRARQERNSHSINAVGKGAGNCRPLCDEGGETKPQLTRRGQKNMARKQKRKPGSGSYADYSAEKLNECLAVVQDETLSTRAAAVHFGIPRRTIMNKLKGHHASTPGRPARFSGEEEKILSDYVIAMSKFGFPIDKFELRCIVSACVDRAGRVVKRFPKNLPRKEWVRSFLVSHLELTVRFTANIAKLKETLDGVTPENIWNYDESNLTDDTGSKRAITKKGVKYPENIRNASKASVSIMMCGSVAGEVLPPYVVYRSQHMWSTWREGGPAGGGWFTAEIFTDWFQSLILLRLKKSDGKKVLIGENLFSHTTPTVLQLCEQNYISFVCLPPNSTHLTQPLDVAFFRPMKVAWKKCLGQIREREAGIHSAVLQKQHFQRLSKELMKAISINAAENLKSGFRKCGIHPCNLNDSSSYLEESEDEMCGSGIKWQYVKTEKGEFVIFKYKDEPFSSKIQSCSSDSVVMSSIQNLQSLRSHLHLLTLWCTVGRILWVPSILQSQSTIVVISQFLGWNVFGHFNGHEGIEIPRDDSLAGLAIVRRIRQSSVRQSSDCRFRPTYLRLGNVIRRRWFIRPSVASESLIKYVTDQRTEKKKSSYPAIGRRTSDSQTDGRLADETDYCESSLSYLIMAIRTEKSFNLRQAFFQPTVSLSTVQSNAMASIVTHVSNLITAVDLQKKTCDLKVRCTVFH
ncbi:hypothetical protein PR048_010399 [Dryococelus australis]|uniref:Transposase n=1 Tax=Dryococelus australis TaxID=614101 RepID=A0ABQ9I3R4_9NEOP|nr:hypothetical protein PR048_010399 [Dryococelus australis]